MTRRTLVLGGLLAIGACAGTTLLLDKGPESATLHVEIRGIESDAGQLRCALFGTPDGFPGEPDSAARVEMLPLTADTAEWVVSDLATGIWAVAILHDADANGEMATDWMGRPSEGWGVTNDARGSFGPPSFEDAAVEIGPGENRVVVNLSY